jgi:oligosaccharide repeat unit polymerase
MRFLVFDAFLYASVFLFGYWLWTRRASPISREGPRASLYALTWVLVALVSVRLAVTAYQALVVYGLRDYVTGAALVGQIKDYGRFSVANGWFVIINYALTFSTVACCGLYIRESLVQNRRPRFGLIAGVMIAVPILELQRAAIFFGVIFVAVAYIYTARVQGQDITRRFIAAAIGAMLAIGAGLSLGLLRENALFHEGLTVQSVGTRVVALVRAEVSPVVVYSSFRTDTGRAYPFQWGRTIFGPLVLKVVPRSWATNKPTNSAAFYMIHYDPKDFALGFVLSPTIWASLFLNFGYVGTILGSFLLGLLSARVDRIFVERRTPEVGWLLIVYYNFYLLLRQDVADMLAVFILTGAVYIALGKLTASDRNWLLPKRLFFHGWGLMARLTNVNQRLSLPFGRVRAAIFIALVVILAILTSAWIAAGGLAARSTARVSPVTGSPATVSPATGSPAGAFSPGTDITASIQSQEDACPALGCRIDIPPGSFFLSGTIHINKATRIVGSGRESTVLTYTPTTGNAFETTVLKGRLAVGFADFKIRNVNPKSSVAFHMAYVEPATFRDMWIDGFVGGIRVTGNGTSDQSVGGWITNARIENIQGAGAFAISLDHVGDVWIDSLQGYTATDNRTATQIIIDRGAQGIYLDHLITIGGLHNLVVRDSHQGGNYGIEPSAIHCESSYFDSATGGSAVVFDASIGTGPVRAMFSNCWAGGAGLWQGGPHPGDVSNPKAGGVEIFGGSDIQWVGGVIRRNSGSGFLIGGSAHLDLIQIMGMRIIANNAGNAPDGAGILVTNPNAAHVSVSGNTIGNMIDELGHQKFAISFPNGGHPTTAVTANSFGPNELGTINYGKAGCTFVMCQ